MKRLIILPILFFLITFSAMAQGKIFPANQSNQLFGSVTEKYQISLVDLKTYITKTEKYFYINIVQKSIFILGDARKPILGNPSFIKESTPFHKFSKTILQEFINLSEGLGISYITLEVRGDDLILSNGINSLNYAQLCPPFCS